MKHIDVYLSPVYIKVNISHIKYFKELNLFKPIDWESKLNKVQLRDESIEM